MDNGNPNAIHPVFVYGTLMRFQRANHMLETGIYMGEAILPDYAMYHLGRYPGIKPCSGEQVMGELYRVDDATLRQMDEYEENNNPLLLFLKEEEPEVENQTTQSIYKAYKAFCIANGFQGISNIEFTKQIKKNYKMDVVVKKIDGKAVRVFVRRGR